MFSKSVHLCKGPKNVFSFAERMYSSSSWHGTTILCVRKDGNVVMAGDGQASQGPTIAKGTAVKVRRIGIDNNILVGFAGTAADGMALLDRLEKKIEEYPDQLPRACVELTKAWRSEKYLRNFDATLVVADRNNIFELTGNGDVLDPESGVVAVGSGGSYALSAALALLDTPLDAEGIVRKAMKIAGDICVYTNHNIVVEKLQEPTTSGSPPAQSSTS